jgi:hypothetical protein
MAAFAIGLYNIRDVSWRSAYRAVVDKQGGEARRTLRGANHLSLGGTGRSRS